MLNRRGFFGSMVAAFIAPAEAVTYQRLQVTLADGTEHDLTVKFRPSQVGDYSARLHALCGRAMMIKSENAAASADAVDFAGLDAILVEVDDHAD